MNQTQTCSCGCHNHQKEEHHLPTFLMPALSLAMLVGGLLLSHFDFTPFTDNRLLQAVWYLLAILPVGIPVVREAAEGLLAKDPFNEFTLMSVACIGAFCIGEFPEAVGVMLFYTVGETLQDRAVEKARRNIATLIDVRGDRARVVRDGKAVPVDPKTVAIGETVEVRPGERVPLDGVIAAEGGVFDTSALTGESMPRTLERGDDVLAGMISTGATVRVTVTKEYGQSTLSRILELVRDASERKARSELFIRKFARVYTPTVMALALLLVAVPWIVSLLTPAFNYDFAQWLYRALVFLVISCPCALVVSIPLGYFAGIGAAARNGILFKGGNFLETVTRLTTVAFDKTGTLTTGRFSVENVESVGLPKEELTALLASAELHSTHPLSRALADYAVATGIRLQQPSGVRETAGYGVEAMVDGRKVMAGNLRLLKKNGITYPEALEAIKDTIIAGAVDGRYAGFVTLADTMKPDAARAVAELRQMGVGEVVMLSGDRKEIVEDYARRLGITEAHGELLPQDKAAAVERLTSSPGKVVAFVGDGMNDAPVLALSDIGIAMGGLGSDAAIESADVVIQTDNPARVATAVKIGRTTHTIVKENIIAAIAIKATVLALGAAGLATLWAAVFADVGVALIAVVNSMRILWKKY